MSDASTSGDSSELEALFDSIAGGVVSTALPPVTPVVEKRPSLIKQAQESDDLTEDSQDLQALFDSIASKNKVARGVEDSGEASDAWPVQQKVFTQVGQMARQLHDTLGALGYDKIIEKTVSALPDAKDRLAYIANLTEQAACRVLNATDIANPLQEELEEGAVLLANKWDALYANKLTVEEFKLLASETRAYLKNAVPQRTSATKDQLMEIMMAQDFQDLTGQVIKKVVDLAQRLEQQLLQVLIEAIPPERKAEAPESLMNGPVISAVGRDDVVSSQEQVDDLLESLGF